MLSLCFFMDERRPFLSLRRLADFPVFVLFLTGEAASAFKRRKVDDAPLVSGPWNIFSLHKPEGFKLPVLADNQDAILTELRSNLPSAGEQRTTLRCSVSVLPPEKGSFFSTSTDSGYCYCRDRCQEGLTIRGLHGPSPLCGHAAARRLAGTH